MYVLLRVTVERKNAEAVYDFTDVTNHVDEVLRDQTKHDERVPWMITKVEQVHTNMG